MPPPRRLLPGPPLPPPIPRFSASMKAPLELVAAGEGVAEPSDGTLELGREEGVEHGNGEVDKLGVELSAIAVVVPETLTLPVAVLVAVAVAVWDALPVAVADAVAVDVDSAVLELDQVDPADMLALVDTDALPDAEAVPMTCCAETDAEADADAEAVTEASPDLSGDAEAADPTVFEALADAEGEGEALAGTVTLLVPYWHIPLRGHCISKKLPHASSYRPK